MDAPIEQVRKGIFLNLSLFQFLSFVRRGVFYTFMITYLFKLMQTVTYTALLGTFDMVASALGQNLLWGRLSDRYRIRTKLIVAGESIAAVTYIMVFVIHKSLLNKQAEFAAGMSLIIGLSILEFFWSMSDVGWAALLTDVTTTETRGRIVGTLNFIASLGRMIGIIFAGFLYQDGEGFSQGTLFYIVVAMLAGSSTLMWVTSRTTGKAEARRERNDAGEASKKAAVRHNRNVYWWFLLSLILIVIGAACISQVFILFIQLPNGLHATDPEMSLILTAWTLGGMFASLACGHLADRFGRAAVIMAGLAIAILTPTLYGWATSIPSLALIYALNGVSFWIIQTVGFTFAGDIIPEDRRGRLFGIYNAVMALSWGPAGLLVGGPLADYQTRVQGLTQQNAYINTFYASSIIVAVGTIVFIAKVARSKKT